MITVEPPRGMDASAEAGLARAPMLKFLRLARAAVGLDGEVHVLLADDATLRRLNRQFRGKDKATDVLSFPAASRNTFHGEKELAGDLAISLETAARQAKKFGHTLKDEVRVLMLHGLLHLAGFDHEQDAGQMAARERELRSELGLRGGLIERVSDSGNQKSKKTNAGVPRLGAARLARDDGFKVGSGPRKGARSFAQDDGKKSRAAVRSGREDGIAIKKVRA